MQLFICDEFKINWDKILVSNTELLQQLRKVLRAKLGYIFWIQNENTRYKLELVDWNNDTFEWKVLGQEELVFDKKNISMLIAMPNKWDKLELIVQKLSEIGVSNIYIWASSRSIIKQKNENKFARILKIAKEATEQAWGTKTPNIEFVDTLDSVGNWFETCVFDLPEYTAKYQEHLDIGGDTDNKLGIVGPEWWLTNDDYTQIKKSVWIHKTMGLWKNVLRTETACIIWAWLLKNNS